MRTAEITSLELLTGLATDLTTVEEVDTQTVIEDTPATPPRPVAEVAIPHHSPGAVSEMSGTTAISSFTMIEADKLQPRFMLRHLPKLYQEAVEFGEHLVPQNGRMEDDDIRIKEMLKPDSDFVADYNDLDQQLMARIAHFRGEHQRYIHIRAVHAALFGSGRDVAAAQTGLDLILYQANLIVLAKQMIHSDRNDKDMERAIRELDSSFPALFLPALILGINAAESATGDSALLQETFELALELRTQLAILCLEQGAPDEAFDPDAALEEVFFHSQSTENDNHSAIVRGWSVSMLGEEDALPKAFMNKVVYRINEIRSFFLSDDQSLGRGETVDLEGLGSANPWKVLLLRLLGWVRSRSQELQAAIQQQGGELGILEKVKAEIQEPTAAPERVHLVPRVSPRKKRSTFGRDRRRSSRKFDPNAEVNDEVLDKIIARERGAAIQSTEAASQHETPGVEAEEEVAMIPLEEDDWLPPHDDEQDQVIEPPQDAVQNIAEEASAHVPESSRPPQSTGDFVKLLKETRTLDKENRGTSLFERQATAQRVDFGDGFDESQPTPGPSRKGKEPQRSTTMKRRRQIGEVSDEEDDDAFETQQRDANVQQQRAKAKRVRIDPSSSGAPTSHQPQARDEDVDIPPVENEEPSESEVPEMTEEAPPRSTLESQKALARASTLHRTTRKPRRARALWSVREEEALIDYMAEYPKQYSKILAVDKEGEMLLQQRTQVDLKDKVRNMAKIMIKSGAGLRPGFQDVVTPAIAAQLLEDGYVW
ncbi:hypothetical protein N0V90_000800 [Kalmusia sp. IMI 367209]|nr:hypothetical protein N0V90_000800 [Kalmusia sp. IMI 367209]